MNIKEVFKYFYTDEAYCYLEWLYKDPSGEEHLIKLRVLKTCESNQIAIDKQVEGYLLNKAKVLANKQYREDILSRGDLHIISKKVNEHGELVEDI